MNKTSTSFLLFVFCVSQLSKQSTVMNTNTRTQQQGFSLSCFGIKCGIWTSFSDWWNFSPLSVAFQVMSVGVCVVMTFTTSMCVHVIPPRRESWANTSSLLSYLHTHTHTNSQLLPSPTITNTHLVSSLILFFAIITQSRFIIVIYSSLSHDRQLIKNILRQHGEQVQTHTLGHR